MTYSPELDQGNGKTDTLMDLPPTLDRGGEAPLPRRVAGYPDGLHELDRGLIADRTMRSFGVVLVTVCLAF